MPVAGCLWLLAEGRRLLTVSWRWLLLVTALLRWWPARREPALLRLSLLAGIRPVGPRPLRWWSLGWWALRRVGHRLLPTSCGRPVSGPLLSDAP